MIKVILKLMSLLCLIFCFFSCSDKTRNDFNSNIIYTSSYSPSWVVYSDFFNITDFRLNYYTENVNSKINSSYNDGGNISIMVYWDGSMSNSYFDGNVANYYGFYIYFISTRDISQMKYNKIMFDVKGDLSSNYLEVKGVDFRNKIYIMNAQINGTDYTRFGIEIDKSTNNFNNIVSFVIKGSNNYLLNNDPATIYIDNIEFIRE